MKEEHLKMTIDYCTGDGCTPEDGELTMDGNWRWLHKTGDYQPNCFTDNKWDPKMCPDPETCTKNCAMDGISADQYSSTYGVKKIDGGVSLRLVTKDQYGTNVGSRLYYLESVKSYKMFKLVNKEFTIDVDVSQLVCGLNGALYFVEMPQDGGMSKFPTNKAGAKYGTGYCDAQCPHDIKFINGAANLKDWDTRANGTGAVGTCCTEMDIWEANKWATAWTPHACEGEGRVACEGATCYDTCDQAGCDFNTFRMGAKGFFGPGDSFDIDSTKPFTAVTQFISSDGTDDGDLVEIRRLYVQDGKVVKTPMTNISDISPSFNTITKANCAAQKKSFGDDNDFQKHGGLKKMGEVLKRGMVLVLSHWDDAATRMLWLDSIFPKGEDPMKNGVQRGPCATDSGAPADIEKKYPDATVKYLNIKYGVLNSTFPPNLRWY